MLEKSALRLGGLDRDSYASSHRDVVEKLLAESDIPYATKLIDKWRYNLYLIDTYTGLETTLTGIFWPDNGEYDSLSRRSFDFENIPVSPKYKEYAAREGLLKAQIATMLDFQENLQNMSYLKLLENSEKSVSGFTAYFVLGDVTTEANVLTLKVDYSTAEIIWNIDYIEEFHVKELIGYSAKAIREQLSIPEDR